jgi:hypothetical protein
VVHQVQLCEDSDRPLSHGINMAGQLQRFRIDKIDVGRRDGENDTVRLRDVFGDEVACLLFDVCRLVADGYLQLLAPPLQTALLHAPLSDPADRRVSS